MRARIDLTLGVPRGGESRKVIVDLKTGRLLHRHREDLRFYALIETLVRDVPPRLLASYSLDSGGGGDRGGHQSTCCARRCGAPSTASSG